MPGLEGTNEPAEDLEYKKKSFAAILKPHLKDNKCCNNEPGLDT